MVKLNDDTIEGKIQESDVLILKIGAEWCHPCRTLIPIMSDLEEKYSDEIHFGSIDIDQCPNISSTYSITSIPVILFFKGSKVIERLVGHQSKKTIENLIKKLID